MSEGGASPGEGVVRQARRFKTDVRTLIVLIACRAVTFWAMRRLWENYDPVLVEARLIQQRAIQVIQSGKPAESLTAIQELARLRFGDSTVAIAPLIGALDDPSIAIRIAAAEALSSIGTSIAKSRTGREPAQASATALIRCLTDQEPAVRVAAIKALGWIGSSLVESGAAGEPVRASASALIQCLKDPEPRVRSEAATALEKFSPPRLASMASPPIERKTVINALAGMLGDRDPKVRLAAINAMTAHPARSDPPDALVEGLKDESAENRAAVIRGLMFFRQGLDPWVPILLRLAEHDPDPAVRAGCFNTPRQAFKPPAVTAASVPVLIASLRSGDANVRTHGILLLSELGFDARAAIPELLRILNEPLVPGVVSKRGPAGTFDPGCEAASALGRIAPDSVEAKRVITALMEAAATGPINRRGWAAHALGEFGSAGEEAVPVLIKVIKDSTPDDEFERAPSAAWALGKIAPDTPSADVAIKALLPVLESRASLSRAKAIEALGHFGPKAAAAIPRLRALKDDRNGEVRNAVAKALVAIDE
jgi:HEAT repeat protein